MPYKNRSLVLALCTFIGNVNASEATEGDSLEVISKAEMEELKQLLKVLDSEEFVAAVQIAADKMVEGSKILADAMVESSKVAAAAITKTSKKFGLEAAKKWADKKTEESKSAKDALIKSSEEFSRQTVRQCKLMIWVLVSLYAAQSIYSVYSVLNN